MFSNTKRTLAKMAHFNVSTAFVVILLLALIGNIEGQQSGSTNDTLNTISTSTIDHLKATHVTEKGTHATKVETDMPNKITAITTHFQTPSTTLTSTLTTSPPATTKLQTGTTPTPTSPQIATQTSPSATRTLQTTTINPTKTLTATQTTSPPLPTTAAAIQTETTARTPPPSQVTTQTSPPPTRTLQTTTIYPTRTQTATQTIPPPPLQSTTAAVQTETKAPTLTQSQVTTQTSLPLATTTNLINTLTATHITPPTTTLQTTPPISLQSTTQTSPPLATTNTQTITPTPLQTTTATTAVQTETITPTPTPSQVTTQNTQSGTPTPLQITTRTTTTVQTETKTPAPTPPVAPTTQPPLTTATTQAVTISTHSFTPTRPSETTPTSTLYNTIVTAQNVPTATNHKTPEPTTTQEPVKKAPFPDPKSRIPVIVQEVAKRIPELGDIIAGSSSPNATQLREIYDFIQGLKRITPIPKSVLNLYQELEKSNLFDVLKTTMTPNTTQIPSTPSPFTSWWGRCSNDSEALLYAFLSEEMWALKMFDASGKPGHSILEGNRKFFGNYKECINSHSDSLMDRVDGNICRLTFDLNMDVSGKPLSTRIEWDLCLPKSCEGSDLTLLANQTFESTRQVSNMEVICTKDLDLYKDEGAIGAICVLVILCILVMVGTLLDLALAMESDGEENYIINGYDTPSKRGSTNSGFELRESSLTASERKPRPVSRIDELKGALALDMEMQHVSNGRGPSLHGGIGRNVMGFTRGNALSGNYNQNNVSATPNPAAGLRNNVSDTPTPVAGLRNSVSATPTPATGLRVNPMFMPGENTIGSSDGDSVQEFTPGGGEEPEYDKSIKEDNTDASLPRWQRFLLAFSIQRNMKKILSVKASPGSIKCIHGIKVLSMGWVILGHTYLSILNTFQNSSGTKDLISTLRGQIIYSASFAVDTFFIISGLLTAYWIMKECGKVKKVPVKTGVMYYVHRFWRLTPPYMLWVMVVATLLQYVGEGRPAWRDYARSQRCRDNWWTNLLYVNNLYKNDENDMCLPVSWYLANDMQFHIVAPLALIPWVFGFKVVGFLTSGLMVALHFASNIWLQIDIDGGDLIRNSHEYSLDIHIQPYTRVAPYAIGLMVGWCLWKSKAKLDINKYASVFGWILCLCVVTILTLVPYDKNKDIESNKWTLTGQTAYETLSRPLWSLAVAWMTVACATGNGGFINSFLSWGGWLPLSRLTYCVYLVHSTVISFEEAAVESIMFFTETLMVYRFFGFLVMSYLVGLILSLAAESPLIAVEKVFLPKR